MGKILAFTNQKGGTGKTTLSANLAVLWSNSRYKVAVIDGDHQKSLTYWIEALIGVICLFGIDLKLPDVQMVK